MRLNFIFVFFYHEDDDDDDDKQARVWKVYFNLIHKNLFKDEDDDDSLDDS